MNSRPPPARQPASLKRTLAWSLFGLCAGALFVAGASMLLSSARTHQSAVSGQQQLLARDAARTVSRFVEEHLDTLRTAVWVTDLHGAPADDRQRVLAAVLGQQPALRWLVLLDAQERVIARRARLAMPSDDDVARLFPADARQRLRERPAHVGRVSFDPATGEPRVVLAVPARDVFGDWQGVLLGEVNLKFMWEVIGQLNAGRTGQAFVVNREGTLLACADASRVPEAENLSHLASVAGFIASESPTPALSRAIGPGLDGERVLGICVALGTPDWAVITELPLREVYREVIHEAVVFGLILLGVSGLAGFVGVRVAGRLTGPLADLTDVATRIAGGARQLQATVDGPEEVARLAAAFNSMTAQLRQSMGELEQRVAEVERTEAALREKSEELDRYFTSALDLLCIADTDGCFRRLNHEWEKVLGYRLDELQGTRFLDYVHPDDLAATQAAVARLVQQESVLSFVNRYRCKDGSYRWIEWRSLPVGKLIYAAARDITERKQAEQLLEVRVRLMEFAVGHSVEEVLQRAVDEAGELTDSPVGFFHFVERDETALSLQAWSTRTKAEFCQAQGQGMHYPLDQAGVWTDCVRQRRAVIHNDYAALPHRKGLPEGHAALTRELVVPVFREDRIVAILGLGNKPRNYTEEDVNRATFAADLAWEIAARKRTESELQRTHSGLEEIGIGVLQIGPDARILSANAAICRALGYPADELRGLRVFDIDPSLTPDHWGAHRCSASAGQTRTFETWQRRKDGSTLPVEVTVTYHEEHGQLHGLSFVRDITERKRVEREKAQMADMLAASLNEIYLFDAHTLHFLYLNEGALRNLGYTLEQALTLTPVDIKPEFTEASFTALVEPLRRGEQSALAFETTHRRADGTVYPVEAHLQLFERETGAVFLAVIQDISDRKRAELALRESEERYALAQKAANMGSWDWNILTGEIRWSEQIGPIFGLAPGTSQIPLDQFFSLVHADDREPISRALKAALEAGADYNTAHRILWPDGSVRWVSEIGEVLRDAAGRPVRMLGVVQDITARKQAEDELFASRQMLRTVLNTIPTRVFWKDRDSVYRGCNEAFARDHGLDAPEVIVGKTDRDTMSAAWAERYLADDREVLATGQSKLGYEEPQVRLDGSSGWLLTNKVPLYDAQGRVNGVLGTYEDITERKRAAAALEQEHALLRTLIDLLPDGIYVKDRESRFVVANRILARRFGQDSPDALLGRSDHDFFPLAAAARYRANEETVLSGTALQDIEEQVAFPDGATRTVLTTKVPLCDSGGEVLGLVGLWHDITERKRSEQIAQRLAQLGREFSSAAESSQAAEALAEAAQELLGWDACFLHIRTPDLKHSHYVLNMDTIEGRRVSVPSTTGDAVGLIERRVMENGACLILREPGSREMFVPFGDTSRPSASLMYVPLRHQGRYLGMFSIQSYRPQAYDPAALELLQTMADHVAGALERIRAEQALRESEHRFRAVLESAQAVIFMLDGDGVFRISEGRALPRLGLRPGQVVGQSAFEVYREVPSVVEGIRQAQAGTVNRTINKIGNVVFDTVYSPYRSPDGQTEGVVGVGIDITERTRAEAALKESQERLGLALEGADLGSWDWNVQSGETAVNARWAEMLGYRPDEITPHVSSWETLVHPDDLPRVREVLQAHLDGRTPFYATEHRMRHKSGHWVWVLDRGKVISRDAGGKPLRAAGTHLDITERKATEAALERERVFTRAVLDSVPGLLYLYDDQGRLVRWNKAHEAATGYRPDELSQMHVLDWFRDFPEDAARIRAALERIPTAGHAEEEARLVTKDGRAIPFLFNAVNLMLEGRWYFVGVGLDLTERKRAETALRQSEERFRHIFEHSRAIMLLVDAESGAIAEANAAAAGFYGYSREQLRHMVIEDINRLPPGQVKAARRRAEAKQSDEFEFPHRLASGEIRTVEVRSSPVIVGDRRLLFSIIQDITERKKVEEHNRILAEVLDITPAAISIHDYAGQMRYANRRCLEMHGWTEAEFVRIKLHELDVPESAEQIQERMRLIEQRGEAAFEVAHFRKDRSVLPLMINVRRTVWGGEPVLLSVGTDISERKQTEQERERLIRELEAKNAELERFTYTVSHDLKSPLITIKGFAGALIHDVSQGRLDRVPGDLKRIASATDKMAELLGDLLELSRIGRMMNPPSGVDLNPLLGEVVELMTGPATQRQVEVVVQPALPVVHGDRQRLREVFQNLIENAIRFMGPQPHARIEIGVRDQGAEKVFFVRDNGLGIEPRYHETVFGLFNKLDAKTAGTGIGLALVRRVVEVHGGRIWVESEGLGRGATFCFTLPLNPPIRKEVKP